MEDELHVVVGCVGTGTLHWAAKLNLAWTEACASAKVAVNRPPAAWLQQHRLQLRLALIPASLWDLPDLAPAKDLATFVPALHKALANLMAEDMRRREQLRPQGVALRRDPRPDAVDRLGADRQLSPAELMALDALRSAGGVGRGPSAVGGAAGVSAAMRRRHNVASRGALGPWLRGQLDSRVLRRIDVAREGEPTAALLVLWEVRSGRVYPRTFTTVSVKGSVLFHGAEPCGQGGC